MLSILNWWTLFVIIFIAHAAWFAMSNGGRNTGKQQWKNNMMSSLFYGSLCSLAADALNWGSSMDKGILLLAVSAFMMALSIGLKPAKQKEGGTK